MIEFPKVTCVLSWWGASVSRLVGWAWSFYDGGTSPEFTYLVTGSTLLEWAKFHSTRL